MDRRNFLKLLGSISFLGFPPVRALLSPLGGERQGPFEPVQDVLTPEQVEALEKIKLFEAQLQEQKGGFSWYLHNELRHYWGAFSETKSLWHANTILEYSIMDHYIMNTLSDWHDAPEYEPSDPDLALASLRRRAENFPGLRYVRAACWLKSGEILEALGDGAAAQDHYRQVVDLGEEFQNRGSRLIFYKHLASARLLAQV